MSTAATPAPASAPTAGVGVAGDTAIGAGSSGEVTPSAGLYAYACHAMSVTGDSASAQLNAPPMPPETAVNAPAASPAAKSRGAAQSGGVVSTAKAKSAAQVVSPTKSVAQPRSSSGVPTGSGDAASETVASHSGGGVAICVEWSTAPVAATEMSSVSSATPLPPS